MSHIATAWAYAARPRSSAAKFVLVALADFANARGSCFPSLCTLANRVQMAKNTVIARIKELVADGFVHKVHRERANHGQTSNEYVLLLDEAARAYAATLGWVEGEHPAPVTVIAPARPKRATHPAQLSLALAAEMGPVTAPRSTCPVGGSAAARTGVVHAAVPLNPSIETDSNPPSRSDGEGDGQSDQVHFAALSAAFPDNDLDLAVPAQRAWQRLSPDEREKAVRHAPDYLAATNGYSRRPLRKTYLQDKGWENFAAKAAKLPERPPVADRAAPASPIHAALQRQVGGDVYASWFGGLEVISIDEETATVALPSAFLKTWVAQHYGEVLLAAVSAVEPGVRRVAVTVRHEPLRHVLATVSPCLETA